MTRVTVIGIGGIGSHLVEWVARFLAHHVPDATLTLVDGDTYDEHNRERQALDRAGNKAQAKAAALAERHPDLRIEAVPEFLTPENADFVVLDGGCLLVCVDNHATRKLVADIAAARSTLTVISGGNEETWGSVQVHLRREGRDRTPPLTYEHPEIAQPKERPPWELNCEERAVAGEPQVFAANLMAASIMFNAFWRFVTNPDGLITEVVGAGEFQVETGYHEVYFDTYRNVARSRRHAADGVPATVQEAGA